MFSCCCEKRNLDQGGAEAPEEEADPEQPGAGAAPFKCGAHRSFLCFKSINFDIVGWDGRDTKLCQKLVLFYGVKTFTFVLILLCGTKTFRFFHLQEGTSVSLCTKCCKAGLDVWKNSNTPVSGKTLLFTNCVCF